MRNDLGRSGDILATLAGCAAVALITMALSRWIGATNPTIAALVYLLVVLTVAAVSVLWAAIATSVLAVLCLNYFFMPPVGTFHVADPENWVAIVVFVAVSIVASNLSSSVRARATEALLRDKQLLEERQAAELARKSGELKTALLASLGHDLRTPLTAIRVAASNLQAAWLDEGERREQANIVLAEVGRLNRLFQNILDMVRIETHAVDTEREWVTPAEIVEAALAQAGYTLGTRQLSVQADGDRSVQVDPRLTSAALAHIIENAGQYSPEGSTVSIVAGIEDDELRIVVLDEGSGIASDDLPHLFNGFYRGKAARQHSFGTGLGLAITRGLVAAEGGRVWAESRTARGAQFSIAIPAESRSNAPEPVECT